MPELAYTPVHRETGISLPVLVTPEDFVATRAHPHHSEHPSNRPELQDYAGKVLRRSRTQQLPDHLHSNYSGAYHSIFWGPETLPEDDQGKIVKALLNLGGVIPREAIILDGEGYDVRALTDDEHSFLSHPKLTMMEARNSRNKMFHQRSIGHSIIRYALDQELDDIASSKVQQEFVRTFDRLREKELGNQMIRVAIDQAIRPALDMFEAAREEGMVDAARLSLRSVVRNFVPASHFGNYYEILFRKLADPEMVKAEALQTGVNRVQFSAVTN